jgi:hypothetical protein
VELQIIVALMVNFLNENLNTILRRRAYCPKTESSAVVVDFEGVPVPVLGLRRCAVRFDMRVVSSNSTDAVPSEKSIYDASAVARGVVDGDARLCSLLGRKKTDLSVALFLPFRCNKCRPTDAKRDTKRKPRITRFQRVRRADQQGNPTGGKGRLTTFFPPVNRRVAGSSPARGANSLRKFDNFRRPLIPFRGTLPFLCRFVLLGAH